MGVFNFAFFALTFFIAFTLNRGGRTRVRPPLATLRGGEIPSYMGPRSRGGRLLLGVLFAALTATLCHDVLLSSPTKENGAPGSTRKRR